jgi:putative ABC transport system substrate-binding protein
MRRRDFIVGIVGSAASWPLAARAQLADRVRRIAVLSAFAENNSDAASRVAAFEEGLQKFDWIDGKNLRIIRRWAASDPNRLQQYAAELVDMKPEVIFAAGAASLSALRDATHSIPIVFAQIPDPVQFGFVRSLAQPGDNITGYGLFDKETQEKWLELLKEIDPNLRRAVFMYDPINPVALGQLAVHEKPAAILGVQLSGTPVRTASEIEHVVVELARQSDGCLILLPGGAVSVQLPLIADLAIRYKLPAIYPYPEFVAYGGLASYGVDLLDHYRQAASYVDRILKGAKPADLPVELTNKFLLTINLKTAKALGFTVPNGLLNAADKVIE